MSSIAGYNSSPKPRSYLKSGQTSGAPLPFPSTLFLGAIRYSSNHMVCIELYTSANFDISPHSLFLEHSHNLYSSLLIVVSN